MRKVICIILLFQAAIGQSQNPLVIPQSITGTNFNLNVQSGTKIFYGTTPTPTYGINGAFLSPTIIVNKGILASTKL